MTILKDFLEEIWRPLMIHSKHAKQGFGGVDPDALQKMLPKTKCSLSKCSPSKCYPKKMLLEKNAPQKKFMCQQSRR